VRNEVLYNMLIEFGIRMKLIKICFNEIYSNVPIGKQLSDDFTIQNGLEEGGVFNATTFQLYFKIHN
jgi:hypothetical protein